MWDLENKYIKTEDESLHFQLHPETVTQHAAAACSWSPWLISAESLILRSHSQRHVLCQPRWRLFARVFQEVSLPQTCSFPCCSTLCCCGVLCLRFRALPLHTWTYISRSGARYCHGSMLYTTGLGQIIRNLGLSKTGLSSARQDFKGSAAANPPC